jgi:hypothetical protein
MTERRRRRRRRRSWGRISGTEKFPRFDCWEARVKFVESSLLT